MRILNSCLLLPSILLVGACSEVAPETLVPPLHYEQSATAVGSDEELERLDKTDEVLKKHTDRCEHRLEVGKRQVYELAQSLTKDYEEYKAAQEAESDLSPVKPGDPPKAIPIDESYDPIGDKMLYSFGARGEKALDRHRKMRAEGRSYLVQDSELAEKYSSFDFGWSNTYAALREVDRSISTSFGRDFSDKAKVKRMHLFLNRVTRLVNMDFYRLVYDWDYYTNHDDVKFLFQMKTMLDSYKGRDNVNDFWLRASRSKGKDFFSFWMSIPYFRRVLKQSRSGQLGEESRFRTFKIKVEQWSESRFGRKSSSFELLDKRRAQVHLLANDFEGAENILEALFEGEWNFHKKLSFDILWSRSSNLLEGGFRAMPLVYHDSFSVTPSVNWSDYQMNLPAGFHDATFMHEMGHVLGLPDEYYNVWDEKRCVYSVVSDESNIMSNSRTGIPKGHHIERLRELHNL
ncbi:hypothetical protein GW916_03935 [bacterium]|nr:hypothetical protein [bacterium]